MGTRDFSDFMKAVMSTGSTKPDQSWNQLFVYDVITKRDPDSTDGKDGNGQGKDMSDFTERKGWSPSYLKLGCFLLFQVCNKSYSTRTRVKASSINRKPQLL